MTKIESLQCCNKCYYIGHDKVENIPICDRDPSIFYIRTDDDQKYEVYAWSTSWTQVDEFLIDDWNDY